MTYHLRLKESPHNPDIDITITKVSPPSDDPREAVKWKAHAQYANGTARQMSATFETFGLGDGMWTIIATALDKLARA